MVIQHNMAAANTNRMLGITSNNLAKSTEKLSSGYKINRAGDDAAGLTISEKMRSQVRGLEKASQNAQDGISLIQTAEGALNETTAILQRMRELAVQAGNDTNTDEDRDAMAAEMEQLGDEITRISTATEFNKKPLLTGADPLTLQIGANSGDGQTLEFQISATALDAATLEVDKDNLGLDALHDNGAAQGALDKIDTAIATISATRSNLGAVQNRLEHTIANLDNINENVTAAESRIRDVDMAKEMVKYSKENILQQAAQSMLAQANTQTQGVLSLLR